MKKKTKSTSSSRIFSIADMFSFSLSLAAALFLAVYGFARFYEGFFSSLKKMNEEPVATVTDTIKLTRRCFEKRTLWDILRKDSLIYNGDTIRTDSNSQTTICFFGDGLELTLASNTMTRISMGKNNQLEVFLSNGNILVDSVKNNVAAKIIYNKTNVSVDGKAMFSAAEIEVPHGEKSAKQLEVQVLEGKIDVQSKGMEKVVVQNGQMVTVATEIEKDDVVSPPVLIEENKDSHEFVLLPQELPVVAMPQEKEPVKNLFSEEYVAIAGDSHLAEKTPQIPADNIENKTSVMKAEERHIAKILQLFLSEEKKEVMEEKKESKKTEAKKEVKPALPVITGLKPASGKVFNDEYFMESPSISFSWTKVSGATHYDFSLYKDGRLIHRQTVKGKPSCNFTKLEKLSNGRFIWKVRAMDSKGPVSQEKQASFTIKLGMISGEASTTETNYKVKK